MGSCLNENARFSDDNDKKMNISEPYLGYLLNGDKRFEGRLDRGKFGNMQLDEVITINKKYTARITSVLKFKTFGEAYDALGDSLMPFSTKTKTEEIYKKIYGEMNIAICGVVVFGFEFIPCESQGKFISSQEEFPLQQNSAKSQLI
jgi:ASC-1-like (ASCH) protein